jgi:elongation factor Ts
MSNLKITTQQIRELRHLSGAGMMDCKKALVESGCDLEKAVRWLREKGVANAAKKSGRVAGDGLVEFAVSEDLSRAAIVEFNCETDFVAKNTEFRSFVKKLAALILKKKTESVEEILSLEIEGGQTVAESLTAMIAKVGENMSVRRAKVIDMKGSGFVSSYDHMGGKIGVLVGVRSPDSSEKALQLGKDVAMHIAASSPRYLNSDSVDASEVEQEKAIARKRLAEQGKPENIMERIIAGQVNKFYSDICLLDQPFVKEPKLSVAKFVKQVSSDIELVEFVRFKVGEGVKVGSASLADDVAAQIQASK